MRGVVPLALASAIALTLLGTGTALAGDHTAIVVDDDRVQCAKAQHTSIQAAVLAAPAGATIFVCPGLYNESVTVHQTLTIIGAHRGDHQNRCLSPDDVADPQHDAIVQVPPGSIFGGVQLLASGVVVDGLVVRGNDSGPGVVTRATASGHQVLRNLIEDNVFGLYLNSNGTSPSLVDRNCFRDNNRPGAAGGDAIYSDQGLANAVVSQNRFARHESAAVVLVSPATTNVRITQNDLVDDSSIVVFDSVDSVIERNVSVRPSGSGIFAAGNTDLLIDRNRIEDATGTGISLTDIVGIFGPNVGTVVQVNHLESNVRGIVVGGAATDSTIAQNTIVDSASHGIRVDSAAVDNRFFQNDVRDSGGDGIWLRSGTAGNTLDRNTARGSGGFDCHDDSYPANTWTRNKGTTALPPVICTEN